jgi:Cu/Ag efflux protein CusF
VGNRSPPVRSIEEAPVKNKLLIGALALALCLAIAVPALAATAKSSTSTNQPSATQPAGAQTFVAVGAVKHVFRTAGAVSLHVDLGSVHVRRFIGGTFVFRVADKARILVISDGIAHLATLSDIQAGDTLRIEGYLQAGTPSIFVAQRIRVLEPIPTDKLTSFGCGGPVTAVDTAKGTVTVTVNNASRALYGQLGDPLTVIVNSGTDLTLLQNGVHTPITLSQVTVGEHAWISGTIDRTQTPPAYTATEMTVRPAPTTSPSPVAAN